MTVPINLRSISRTLAALVCMSWGTMSLAQCDPSVPSFTVDLSSSPTATWMSPSIQRNGQCCSASAPEQCLQLTLTLHPDAQGINFQICEGAVPPGALFYQIDCGPPIQVGQPICLNGPGPFVLTFCKPGNNTNRYCITSIPAPTAGPDIALNDGCSGTLTTSGFAPGTVQWTSIGPGPTGTYNGYLACPTCPNTTVTAQPGFPAFVDYQVCGLAISPCSQNSYCDTVRVHFNPTLGAQILPQQPTVCFGAAGTTITVNGSGGTPPYSYQWSTGATSASIFVGPGTYTVLVSDTSQCPPTSTTVVVTSFSQPIQALAGTDIVVCTDAATVNLNGAVQGATGGQWLTGAGAFQPSNQALNATYTATAADVANGFVDLVLATTGNGTCPGDLDTVRIHFDPGVVNASVSATDVTCFGGSNGIATATPDNPGLSYLWNDPAAQTTATATGLAAGNYTVTITTALGCSVTLPVQVAAPAALSLVNVTTAPESCAGLGNGSATVTATGGTPPYSYAWSTGATSPTITAGAGTYTVQITDANGCAPLQATAIITAAAQPNSANAGPDQIGCLDELPLTLQGSVTNATGGQWSGGTGTWLGTGLSVQYMPSAAEITAGSVTLQLTSTGNTACAAATDQVTIQLSNAFVNATLSPTPVSCAGESNGTATFSPVMPGVSYSWNAPLSANGPVVTGLAAGSYGLTVTDQLGCSVQLAAVVTEPQPLTATVGSTTPVTCAGGNNGTANVTVSGGTFPYLITWSPTGQVGPVATQLPAGTHTASITDAQGCTTQVQALITSPAALSLQAWVPDTVCVNAPQVLSASPNGGQAPYTISWGALGSGSPLTASFSDDQVVTVTVTDAYGCQGPVLNFPVTVLDLDQAQFTLSPDAIVCPGGSVNVSASVSGYPGAFTLFWPTLALTGNGPFTVPVTQTMAVPVILQDACGAMRSDTIDLVLDTPPNIALPDVLAEGCAPLTVQFPQGLTTQNVTYLWSLGNGLYSTQAAPLLTYPTGIYNVGLTVTTAAGCSATASGAGAVIAHGGPQAAFQASPWQTDINNPSIAFTDQSAGSPVWWDWTFGDGGGDTIADPVHVFTQIGTFPVELVVTDVHGCSSSVVNLVTITPDHSITIPNVFTPDPNGGSGGSYLPGDLSNDIFYPFVRFVDTFRMRIFNRWGELVFESDSLDRGWDGYYRGQLSPQDVYVYQVNVRFVDGKEVMRMGDLTLLR